MTESRIENELRRGFEAQRRGDVAAARQAYETVLARQPDQPTALQLLGGLARAAGDLAEAESLWRRSLAADARQPHVWNNLGNLLARTGRLDDALAAMERALALRPDDADALYNQARLLRLKGDLAAAASALNRALARPDGPRASMLRLAAQMQVDAGQLAQALATLDLAAAHHPDHGPLAHDRAVVLQRLHRSAEALAAHQAAAARGVDVADAHYNRGNTLQALGRCDEAVEAYRQALRREPVHALALYDLARLRWRLAVADFDAELREAERSQPQDATATGLRAHLLLRAERWADALDAFDEALRRSAGVPGFQSGRARALSRLGRHREALQMHAAACAGAPDDPELLAHHAEALAASGDAAQAERVARGATERSPQDQHAWAQWALALRLLGDTRHLALHDTEALVAVMDLPPPAGFGSARAFKDALCADLLPLHRDRRSPLDQTLRHGTQTQGNLFDLGCPAVERLKDNLRDAISRWIACLEPQPGHPLLGRLPPEPTAWRFTDSWSSRLVDRGHHLAHVHPHGWLSAVYYVDLPRSIDPADATRAGWLHLGQPEAHPELPVLRWVAPVAGRLVVFPSYLWHGTAAFHDDSARLTIAFDLVPTPA